MSNANEHVAFTDAVKNLQERFGSRASYARMTEKNAWRREVDGDLAEFIAARDSFYLGTVNAEGQPYIQHRGGVPGFLKVLSPTTLAFADLRGNRQYITAGNLAENDRAFIFLMDYANQRRVKIWGRARIVDDDPALIARLVEPETDGKPERVVVFEIEQWDINCPQHIVRRYSEAMIAPVIAKLEARIAELEDEVSGLRALAPGGAGR